MHLLIFFIVVIMLYCGSSSAYFVKTPLFRMARRSLSQLPAVKERVWVDRLGIEKSHDGRELDDSLKVVSYNVLGVMHGEGSKHSYAPSAVTNWQNRREKLLQEMVAMKADIFCLQEVTERGLLDTFIPALSEFGIECHGYAPMKDPNVRVRRPINKTEIIAEHVSGKYANSDDCPNASDGLAYNDPHHAVIGCAVFCNTSVVEMISSKRVLLKDFAPLETCRSQVVMGDVQSKANSMVMTLVRMKATSKLVMIANTHLFWDPRREDIKTMQLCGMAAALTEFCYAAGLDVDDPPPLILCGDFNSMPYRMAQEDSNKEKTYAKELANKRKPNTALFELLTTGTLSAMHAHHPDRWYAHLQSRPNCPRIGDLNIKFKFRNVFDEPFESYAPLFTTKTDDFQGWLDHIFVNDKVVVEQLMVPPIVRTSPMAEYHGQTFQPMPNENYASDHLPIGIVARFK